MYDETAEPWEHLPPDEPYAHDLANDEESLPFVEDAEPVELTETLSEEPVEW